MFSEMATVYLFFETLTTNKHTPQNDHCSMFSYGPVSAAYVVPTITQASRHSGGPHLNTNAYLENILSVFFACAPTPQSHPLSKYKVTDQSLQKLGQRLTFALLS